MNSPLLTNRAPELAVPVDKSVDNPVDNLGCYKALPRRYRHVLPVLPAFGAADTGKLRRDYRQQVPTNQTSNSDLKRILIQTSGAIERSKPEKSQELRARNKRFCEKESLETESATLKEPHR